MEILSILSTVFFYISFGIQYKIRQENSSDLIGAIGGLIGLLTLILPTISFCVMFDLRWYQSIIFNLIGMFLTSIILSSIYISIFGIKTKPQWNYNERRMKREHLYEYDMLVTLVLGFILFVISIILFLIFN